MISVFELFKIGIGPSSSHTVGPMKAAAAFAAGLVGSGAIDKVASVEVALLGSLAFTGKGHATDKAAILGLSGEAPETADPNLADALVARVRETKQLNLAGRRLIAFDPERAISFDTLTPAPRHPNTMRFIARDAQGRALADETWLSIGGGFIIRDGAGPDASAGEARLPYPFRSGAELLARGRENGLSIAELMRANEAALRPESAVDAHVDRILDVMLACIDRGLAQSGPLPGGLRLMRRARAIHDRLMEAAQRNFHPPHEIMDFVSVYAMAVNEENAAGGRVVTAPTNGAAGVVPAVLRYYRDHCAGASQAGPVGLPHDRDRDRRPLQAQRLDLGGGGRLPGRGRRRFVDGGGGSHRRARRLERADRERRRNRHGAPPRHDLRSGGRPRPDPLHRAQRLRRDQGDRRGVAGAARRRAHRVSLDSVVATMRQTGADMQSKYKETSLGGLAVNFIEC